MCVCVYMCMYIFQSVYMCMRVYVCVGMCGYVYGRVCECMMSLQAGKGWFMWCMGPPKHWIGYWGRRRPLEGFQAGKGPGEEWVYFRKALLFARVEGTWYLWEGYLWGWGDNETLLRLTRKCPGYENHYFYFILFTYYIYFILVLYENHYSLFIWGYSFPAVLRAQGPHPEILALALKAWWVSPCLMMHSWSKAELVGSLKPPGPPLQCWDSNSHEWSMNFNTLYYLPCPETTILVF